MTGLITSVPMWPKPIVWPSGSARMMSSFEMTPFAPGRLSTITCRPRLCDIFGAIWRATRSVAPPGGNPTIMRTGLEGDHSALAAGSGVSTAASSATARRVDTRFIGASLRLRARGLDHLRPFGGLGFDVAAELFRAARRDVETLLEEDPAHVRHVEHGREVLVETVDDGPRRLRRHDEPVPVVGLEARHSGLRDSREIRRQLGA